jgi:hypothetical protein
MFENITAPNPKLNTSLTEGHRLQGLIQAQRLGTNPRLYANEVGGGMGRAGLVPETDAQDNSDIPSWAQANDNLVLASNADGNNNPLPPDVPVYLQVWVSERQNFYDVAGVLARVDAGATLDQALN